jgi:hypothetical protein
MTSPDVSLKVALNADLTTSISGWSWTEIGDRATTITWRGPRRSTLAGSISGGQLTVELDNSDNQLDPRRTSGTYCSGGASLIRPGLPVRLEAREFSGIGGMFQLGLGYRAVGRRNDAPPADGTVEWECPDGQFRLNVDRAPSAAAGEGELTGARVGRILDSIGWPAGDRDIDTGLTPCQPTTLEGSALTELENVAATEAADLFMAGSGYVTFYDRDRRFDTFATLKYAFSDLSSTLDPTDVVVVDDDSTVINQFVAQRVGGEAKSASSATSQAKHGILSRSNSSLVAQDDIWVAAMAEGIVYRYAQWAPRVESLTLDPTVNSNLWAVCFDIGIGDHISVETDGFTQDCWVEGVDHQIRKLGGEVVSWRTTVWTSWFGPSNDFGQWDSAVWDTAVWAW